MPVIPGLTTTVRAGQPYYRITSPIFRSSRSANHKQVVNGEGAVRSRNGARYIPRTGRAETFPRVKDYVTTYSPKARILPTVTSREELHHGLVSRALD
jgi:hypothetical protein